jgi:hypothetical protein
VANGEGVLLCPTHISDQSEYLLQPLEDPYVAGPTMACSLRKHCLAGLLPSLRPVTVDFFASTFDIAGKSEVRSADGSGILAASARALHATSLCEG